MKKQGVIKNTFDLKGCFAVVETRRETEYSESLVITIQFLRPLDPILPTSAEEILSSLFKTEVKTDGI